MVVVENVSKIYYRGREEVYALQDISFEIAEGEMLALVGPSGSGKTTLMNLLGLLDKPSSGRIRINGRYADELGAGEMLRVRREVVGFIYQQFLLIPSMTALQNVMLPMYFAGKKETREIAKTLLERVGLGDRLHHLPAELSGGEMQRVSAARALANNPSMILADEPTGNLDRKSAEDVLRLFGEINAEGKTVIIVTHDTELAGSLPRILSLRDGKLA